MNTPLKILILEDSKEDAELIKRLLIKEGMNCEFDMVMDKDNFFKALDQFAPQVILSDNSMPQFNATEALHITRQRSLYIPFILVTGTVSEEFAANIIKLGADDYILKDRLTRLPDAIKVALRHQQVKKERTDAAEKLRQSEENYRTTMERVSDGIVALDKDWRYTYVNRKACIILECEPHELLGQYIWDKFYENDQHTFSKAFQKAMHLQESVHLEEYYEPLHVWLETHIYPSKDGLSLFFKDISERKKAEEDLKRSEIRLNEAQAIAHIGNWEIDFLQNIHTWSDELYRIYGVTKGEEEPSVELFLSFVHPDDETFARRNMRNAFESFISSSFNFRFVLRNGTTRFGYIEWRFEFDKNNQLLRLFGILQDITERKEAEENLQLLEKQILEQKIQEQKKIARAIINAQERERNYIGQELHDNINQILVALKLYLQVAVDTQPGIKDTIQYSTGLLDSAIDEIRLLASKQVTPAKDINLEDSLRSMIAIFENSTGINTVFNYDVAGKEIEDNLQLNIYRIIQEQINNIIKHAKASSVYISIEKNDNEINIMVTDNGIGFEVDQKRKGIGISNIISRVEAYNGEVVINSSPGKGTIIKVILPYYLYL